ncbi:MAG: DMT family transporter [Oligoflexia bacterium]|nr:DMT family transporter [Oligoflexia bacterium]
MSLLPYHILALLNAVLWSLALIFYRAMMSRGADARALVIFGQLGACLSLIATLGFPHYEVLDGLTISLLVASGMLWAFGVFLEIAALKYLEATASGIIAAGRYVVGFLTGIFILGEQVTQWNVLGAALIVAAIIGISEFGRITFERGFWLTCAAVLLQVAAYAIDKHLSASVAPPTIAISSFFFPGLTFLLIYPRQVFHIPQEVRRSRGLLVMLPIMLACCYWAVVTAFTRANFIVVLAIAESSLVFTCFFAYFFLNEKERWLRKIICSLLCSLGVVLVCGGI